MVAIRFDKPGEPRDVLAFATDDQAAQAATLERGQVRVRMLAAPINPSDLSFIRDIYGVQPNCPQSPGFEGVGTVAAANAGLIGKLLIGKQVVVLHPTGGTWASDVVVPARRVVPVGRSIAVEQAAAFFVNPATAFVLCHEVLNIPTGGTLLQTAGGSNLARMISRLGKADGFRTVSVVRRDNQRDELLAEGTDHAIVFDAEKDAADTLKERLDEAGLLGTIRYAIDPVGGPMIGHLLPVLAKDARLVLYGSLSTEDATFSPRELLTAGQSIESFWLSRWMDRQSLWAKMKLIRRLKRLHQSAVCSTTRYRSFPASEIQQAVSAAEQPRNGEKVLLKFDSAN